MPDFYLPFGDKSISVKIPDGLHVDQIAPKETPPAPNPSEAVRLALAHPLIDFDWSSLGSSTTVAIAVNDKTRPVPHEILLPPLLKILESNNVPPENIHFIIATGTHPPMKTKEFEKILPAEIIQRYRISSHDCEENSNLVYLGTTSFGTPVWTNNAYINADLRIVVGNIEPHQFQGFSGGVKSAAIGLAGRATINHNHAMMVHPDSRLGNYRTNPARQDVGEIGEFIGIHFALNAILNQDKKIVRVLAGDPKSVLESGITIAREICQVAVDSLYDFVIASPGGHPKDINLYQSQKGLAHASMLARSGGTIILVAACPEGTGSSSYEEWMQGIPSHESVIERFSKTNFRVGPHKAFQIARDATRVNLFTFSELPYNKAKKLLLNPIVDLQHTIDQTLSNLPLDAKIAIMPRASSTIPDTDNIMLKKD